MPSRRLEYADDAGRADDERLPRHVRASSGRPLRASFSLSASTSTRGRCASTSSTGRSAWGPRSVDLRRVLHVELADRHPSQVLDVRTAAERFAEVRHDAADVGPGRAHDARLERVGRRARDVEEVHRHLPRLDLDHFAARRPLVRPFSADLHGRNGRRRLDDLPDERGRRVADLLGRHVDGSPLRRPRRRRRGSSSSNAEHAGHVVGLREPLHVAKQPRRRTDRDDEEPRRRRVERAGVSDALHAECPAHLRDDVVRRRSRAACRRGRIPSHVGGHPRTPGH